jgi:ABC-type multidrug transport system permease subunit
LEIKASLIIDHASFILSMKANIVYAGKRSNLLLAIIPIVALISVSAVLFIVIYYFLCRRAKKEYNAMHKENGTQ